ncbi:hypothetical protein KKA47_05065 [bacterium]|nr:hypothetical protein [bacterium]
MDPYFRSLVMEVIDDHVDSENFNRLLIETGVSLEGEQWDIANHIKIREEEMMSSLGRNRDTVH